MSGLITAAAAAGPGLDRSLKAAEFSHQEKVLQFHGIFTSSIVL